MNQDLIHLITDAVDGELNDREMNHLRQLLDASSEARAIYERLKADSDRLRGLPRLKPPATLHARVMARIAALTPNPIPVPARRAEPAPRPASHREQSWLPYATAASLLIGVAAASFWFFTRATDNPSVARNANRPPPATKRGANDPEWAKWLPAPDSRLPSAPMPSIPRNDRMAHGDPPATSTPEAVAIAPAPRVPDRDLIGAHPRAALPRFDLVEVRLPFLKALADFDREDVRQQLTEELGQDPAFRIDLFTRNLVRGVELFQTAARTSGVVVHADAASMNFLKKGQIASVVVYTDSLTAPQLTALFTRLSSEDARVSPHVFDMLHATPIGREDEIEIRRVLGTDPGLFKRALPERGIREIEKGKSISAGTADQIVRSIAAGKGKSVANAAVLLTWGPSAGRTPPSISAELKSFLSKRGARKQNAVPVIIVIRHGNG